MSTWSPSYCQAANTMKPNPPYLEEAPAAEVLETGFGQPVNREPTPPRPVDWRWRYLCLQEAAEHCLEGEWCACFPLEPFGDIQCTSVPFVIVTFLLPGIFRSDCTRQSSLSRYAPA